MSREQNGSAVHAPVLLELAELRRSWKLVTLGIGLAWLILGGADARNRGLGYRGELAHGERDLHDRAMECADLIQSPLALVAAGNLLLVVRRRRGVHGVA